MKNRKSFVSSILFYATVVCATENYAVLPEYPDCRWVDLMNTDNYYVTAGTQHPTCNRGKEDAIDPIEQLNEDCFRVLDRIKEAKRRNPLNSDLIGNLGMHYCTPIWIAQDQLTAALKETKGTGIPQTSTTVQWVSSELQIHQETYSKVIDGLQSQETWTPGDGRYVALRNLCEATIKTLNSARLELVD
jgi:hypothetical protein